LTLLAACILDSVEGVMDDDERELLDSLRARDNVSDEELVARINAAPDMGGAMLVELSQFMERRAQREQERASVGERQMRLSDVYLRDARDEQNSMRGRIDLAWESGYLALLAVLPDGELPTEHPSYDAIARAYAILEAGREPDVRLAGGLYRASAAAFTGDDREQAVRAARARYQALIGCLSDDERRVDSVENAMRLARERYYPAEHNSRETVLEWAEHVRARVRAYLEIK
jgi:hypothetical protein